eukprot:TRINITY_DN4422_c0_g2_i1.p1 TRINITY_DN4422_c0_g2~~TRINITY_DN4422_c0_g2_i1.p1  ORF type:complete len:263 (+),score=63.01 TRINITY_DN4422_c0_g2_i1:92-790(+)
MMEGVHSNQHSLDAIGQQDDLRSCTDLQAVPSNLKLLHVPTASTLCTDAEDSCSASSAASVVSEPVSEQCLEASMAQPRFLHCLELAQVNWSRLAKNQEWRRVLKLRGLPASLCNRHNLQAFLKARGLSNDVLKVSVSCKNAARMGSAVLHVSSGQSVAKVARFFHGRLLPGSRMPISVEFATVQEETQARDGSLAEPLRVSIGSCCLACPPGLESIEAPPGLEGVAGRAMP